MNTSANFDRPVMYLDVDDTILTSNDAIWEATYGNLPKGYVVPADTIIPAPGAGEFLEWATEHYEVRWLTFKCPSGVMHPWWVKTLARALKVPEEMIASIRGISFAHTFNKCDGINWEEHAAGREWIWIEDDIDQRELQILAGRGCLSRWIRCNVTEDPYALKRLHERLKEDMAQQKNKTRSLP